MKMQHAQKSEEYRNLQTVEMKIAFFLDHSVPFVKTMTTHFEDGVPLQYLINKSIVEVIIRELFFHPMMLKE